MVFLLSAVLAQESASLVPVKDKIEIDGLLSEEAWKQATPIDNFIQYIPTEGGHRKRLILITKRFAENMVCHGG